MCHGRKGTQNLVLVIRKREAVCREGGVTLGLGGLAPPLFPISSSLFPLWTSEFCPKERN